MKLADGSERIVMVGMPADQEGYSEGDLLRSPTGICFNVDEAESRPTAKHPIRWVLKCTRMGRNVLAPDDPNVVHYVSMRR
jgi:hypothetical protein